MEEEGKKLTIRERSEMAVRIAEKLMEDAPQDGILILEEALHLFANGWYRVVSRD